MWCLLRDILDTTWFKPVQMMVDHPGLCWVDIAGSMGDLLGKFPGLVNSQIPLKSMFWFEVGERQAVSQT